ncbi:hypothetical protein C1I98_11190 [Spongiactinospora gelatinilytica]|uniref:Uncharacterized protein n=1 Tax=Spongiactinospora gelatinilytica TaxID=2666298 RepID=A0A2W2GPR8_9ACTN|nr:hypothetical protein [Spongiactinospora gelatinilytica]PZG49872.1 hypothetical protein C1I98_11190 [Spongiactinospora gelatinilytica]
MTEPHLTPAEQEALDARTARWARIAGIAALVALAMAGAAIWLGDMRWAWTGGLVMLAAGGFGIAAGMAASPETRRRMAARRRAAGEGS